MRLTEHAKKRKNQRGFSKFSIDMIKKFGRCEKAPGGALKIFIGKKEYQQTVHEFKRAIQLLDKAKGGTLIIHQSDLITLYK